MPITLQMGTIIPVTVTCLQNLAYNRATNILYQYNNKKNVLLVLIASYLILGGVSSILNVLQAAKQALDCDHCMQNVALVTSSPPLTRLWCEGD